jgi:PleD family two-component response regulator
LLWLYALVPVPFLTDWIEHRSLPASPTGWLTEVCGGLVITALVWRVRRDRRALEALARSDGLTGLLNRRSFETALAAEFTRARRTRQPLCVVYLDIDRFKAVNDRFGHGAGDQVLPSTTNAQAEAIVARLRSFCAVHDPRWAVGAFDFSAGVVELEADDTAAGLMTRVDAAMYREKNARRTV